MQGNRVWIPDVILFILFKGDENLPPGFFTDHPGGMTFAGNILGQEDVPFPKPACLTAAHRNFSFSFDRYHILPADNIMPAIPVPDRDFPEEERFNTGRVGKKTEGAAGFQLNFRLVKMGLVVLSRIQARNPHIQSLVGFPDVKNSEM
jgi:hypothetical protein